MGCATTIIPIRGGLTSQVTGLGDAANVLVLDTPGYLPFRGRVEDMTRQIGTVLLAYGQNVLAQPLLCTHTSKKLNLVEKYYFFPISFNPEKWSFSYIRDSLRIKVKYFELFFVVLNLLQLMEINLASQNIRI